MTLYLVGIILFPILFLGFYGYGDTSQILLRFVWLFISSLFLFLTLRKLHWSKEQSFLAILWFVITPWVVQQSVSIEGMHYLSLLILMATYLGVGRNSHPHPFDKLRASSEAIFEHYGSFDSLHSLRMKLGRLRPIFSYLTILFLGTFIYPDFWIYRFSPIVSYQKFLATTASFFSFEQFFFRNSFVGAKNAIGIFYPETIPFFLIGMYRILDDKRMRGLFVFLLPLLIITVLTNEIPGGKDFFLLLPYFSIVFVLGLETVSKKMFIDKNSRFLKLFFLSYMVFMLYGIINFIHYFRSHYLPFEMEKGVQ